MNENVKKANERKIETVIKNLEKRNITGHYCETKADAASVIKSLISEGSVVSWGGSATLDEIGIKEALADGAYRINDPMKADSPAEGLKARKDALQADVFLSGINAITMDGEIVNIDGRGNRVAAILFGPDRVVLVAGANKIVPDEKSAIARIKNDACPPNALRLGLETPCALTGMCKECLIKGNTICSHIVTTRFSMTEGRMHVVLVNEILGF